MTGHFVFLAVALVSFWIAYDDGTYGLESRNTLAIAAAWVLMVAVLTGVRLGGRVSREALVLVGLLAGFALWTLASVAWASSNEAAFDEFNRVTLYLAVFVLVILAGSRASVGRCSDGLAAAIASIAAVALASRLFPDVFPTRGLATFLPSAVTRLSFPLGYWNGLAILVALSVPLLLRQALVARSVVVRALALMPFPVIGSVLYLTSSRGGVATALVGTTSFLALTNRRWQAVSTLVVGMLGGSVAIVVLLQRDALLNGPLGSAAATDQGRSAALLIGLACLACAGIYAVGLRILRGVRAPSPRVGQAALAGLVVAVGVAIAASSPGERLEQFKQVPQQAAAPTNGVLRAHLLSGSGSGRWQFWTSAADEWKTHPVRGGGAGSYEQWWAEHGPLSYFVRDAHSLYLETLGELGIVGFALLLAFMVGALVVGVRRTLRTSDDRRVTSAALCAVFFGFAFAAGVDWMWELTAVTVVALIALGLLLRDPPPTPDGPVRARSGRLPVVATRAAIAAAWFLVVTAQAIPLLAHRLIGESQAAVARGSAAPAIKAALGARDVQPWAASPYLQLALVTETEGDVAASKRWIRKALARDPDNWQLWLVAARVETKLGEVGVASQSLARAVKLNPRSPLFEGLKGSVP